MLLLCLPAFTQIKISSGTSMVSNGNVVIVIQDLNFMNDGSFVSGPGKIKFTGNINNNLGGSSATNFNEIEIAKNSNGNLFLQSNITVNGKITFTSGLIDLNQKTLTLGANAFLNNENESSRIAGTNGGEVMITLNMNAPNNVNPGNLGAVFTSGTNMGTVIIKRGHKLQSGTGLTAGINRYFDIQPTSNNGLNATFELHYFDAELNGQSENALTFFQSANGGTNWLTQNTAERNTVTNYVKKTGIQSFYRYTLGAPAGSALPVTGLDFTAKRISSSQVQLDWKTYQEISNKGFYIERQLQNENSFNSIAFVPSKKPDGNSNSILNYQYFDANSYTGKTSYRLRQEDIDGKISYSSIQIVQGIKSKNVNLTSYPNPATSEFYISVKTSEANSKSSNDVVQVFDISGHLVKQIQVQYDIPLKVNGLARGVYIIKLASDNEVNQKQIIQ